MARPTYEQRRLLHKCTRCGLQLEPDHEQSMCSACLELHRTRVRSAMRRKRERDRDLPETMSMQLWNDLRSYQAYLQERVRRLSSQENERLDALIKRRQHLERELDRVVAEIAELERTIALSPADASLIAELKERIDVIGTLLKAAVPKQ